MSTGQRKMALDLLNKLVSVNEDNVCDMIIWKIVGESNHPILYMPTQ